MTDNSNSENKLLKFPCQYPIKVIGRAGDDFEISVIPILHKHIPTLDVELISIKQSSHGKYESLTATFEATSQEQLDNLYRELTANSNVMLVL